jgi:5-methylthioadenosine/S-adenosylhomocysteine deaminase
MVLGNAARALGMGDRIGSLAPGKCADILIVNPDCPVPVVPASVLSYFTSTFQGRHVETVLVGGKIVVRNGAMTTVNEEEVRKACVQEARVLWRKNGIAV